MLFMFTPLCTLGKESEASDDDVDGLPLDAAATLAAKGGSKGLPGISGMG